MLCSTITAYLSPWWGYPPPALCCRSSGWCLRGGSSRSRPSRQPTASTGRRTPSGYSRALGSHGPLEEMSNEGMRRREVCREKRVLGEEDGDRRKRRDGERWNQMNRQNRKWQGGAGTVAQGHEDRVLSGFVCWCFYFLPVLLILHNQLSVWVPAVLSQWGPTLSQMSHCILNIFVWARVTLKNLGAASTADI